MHNQPPNNARRAHSLPSKLLSKARCKLRSQPITKVSPFSRDIPPLVLDEGLSVELYGSVLVNIPGLVEHLFPDALLPLPTETLAERVMSNANGSCWNAKRLRWIGLPALNWFSAGGEMESQLAACLNHITSALRRSCSASGLTEKLIENTHEWDIHAQAFRSAAPFRLPHLALYDEDTSSNRKPWSTILACAEVQWGTDDPERSWTQLTHHALKVFENQDERRFVLGVSFTGYDVRVYVFDRAGIVGSQSFNICDNPTLFIRLLAGLTLAPRAAIGFDASILHEDGKRFVVVDGKKYELLKRLFIAEEMRGRGTICWRARLGGVDYAIKDSWTYASLSHLESDMLAAVAGVEGVAQLVAREDVMLASDKLDSTKHIRDIVDEDKLKGIEVRVHQRVVSTPCAEDVAYFSSQKELLSVFIDAIRAHRGLVEKGILHRDISVGNIMIHGEPAGQDTSIGNKGIRQGLLIDLDNARYLTEKDSEVDGGPPGGTAPFMSWQLLEGLETTNTEPRHDLESFFYVLLWVCWTYEGPNNAERRDFDAWMTTARQWLNEELPRAERSIAKQRYMKVSKEVFKRSVLPLLAPYFDNLKPCLMRLRGVVFEEDVEHEDLIEILQDTMRSLPDVENWAAKDEDLGHGSRKTKKRPREEDDTDDDLDQPESQKENRHPKTEKATSPKKRIRN